MFLILFSQEHLYNKLSQVENLLSFHFWEECQLQGKSHVYINAKRQNNMYIPPPFYWFNIYLYNIDAMSMLLVHNPKSCSLLHHTQTELQLKQNKIQNVKDGVPVHKKNVMN